MKKLLSCVACCVLSVLIANAGDAGKALKIEGTWTVTAITKDGRKDASDFEKDKMVLTFKDGKYTVAVNGKETGPAAFYKIDAKMNPAHIDMWTAEDAKKGKGLVKVEGDVMTIAVSDPGKERVKDFEAATGVGVLILKRGK